MEGKYTLKVDAGGAESAYTVEGKGPDHLEVIGTAMQAVMRTFWRILEQVQDEPVDAETFIAMSAMFMAEVVDKLVKEREAREDTADAKGFMENLLKKANGEG